MSDEATESAEREIERRFESVFYPDSLAVIGASTDEGSPGYRYVKHNVDFGFDPVYPINPNADEIYGQKAYDSVLDVPGPVEFAIVILRADLVPGILEECGEKGVEAVHVMSSGFSETGTEEGKRLEAEVSRIAAEHDITLIGPNCVGIYSPCANLTYIPTAPAEVGPISVVSHSGGFTLDLESRGAADDIAFSKVASIGNSVDVGITDLFEYFGVDDETEIIGAYLEGIESREEGRQLFDLVRGVTAEKPVIVLKGGKTDRGSEAAQSHTGSLAGNYRVWNAMLEQAGAVEVDSINEMIHTLKLFSQTTAIDGDGIALIGPGGGTTVTAIDECTAAGIEVPTFDDGTIEALEGMDLPPAGNLTNPVDAPLGVLSVDGGRVLREITRVAADDDGIDTLVVHLNVNHFVYAPNGEELFRNMVGSVREAYEDISMPLVLVMRNSHLPQVLDLTTELRETCTEMDIPVYDSISEAATALQRLVEYNRRQ